MNNHTVGKTGRLFVEGELTRRGFNVEKSNERLVDFVVNGNTKIKVHTRFEGNNFIMTKEAENWSRDLFYIFVKVQDKQNKFYIVPSILVAQRCAIGHKTWASQKEGRDINSTLRVFFMEENADYLWEDQWQLLELDK